MKKICLLGLGFFVSVLLALFMSVFLFKNFVHSANEDIVITEICPTGCADNGFQWIEIYNKGSKDVDLSGWKFWEATTNHTLATSSRSIQQTFVLASHSYAVIAQNDLNFFQVYPDFSALVLDSSWSVLNKSGEEIGLKISNGDNDFIEKFIYLGIQNNHSLERKDLEISSTELTNWQENPNDNSVGQKNYWSVANNDDENQNIDPVAEILTSKMEFEVDEEINFDGSQSVDSDGEIIKYEWFLNNNVLATSSIFFYSFQDIGQYNIKLQVTDDKGGIGNDSLDLEIVTKTTTSTTSTGTENNYLGIVINEFVSDPVLDNKEWVEIYNNSTTTVNLQDWELHEGDKTSTSTKKILSLDNILETNSFLVVTINSSKLNNDGDLIALYDNLGNLVDVVRYGNWIDTLDENIADNAPDTSDPNAVARIVDGQNTGNNKNDFAVTTQPTPGEPNVIKAVVTAPPNSGGGGNGSSQTSSKVYNPRDLVINEMVSDPSDGEEEFVELFNNTTETVDLTNWKLSDGSEADTVLDGEIDAKNFYVVEKPKGSLNNAGDLVLLTDPSDKEIDKIVYGTWDDGNIYDNAPMASDPYSLIRKVDGQDADNDYYDFVITDTITKNAKNIFSMSGEDKNINDNIILQTNVIINEVFPNPAGSDIDDEFIEIFNNGKETVDLKDWQLSDSTKKKYTIKQGILKSGDYIVFKRSMTDIALNNTGGDEVKLFSSNGSIVDLVSYPGGVLEKQSYVRQEDNIWVWTTKVTSGTKNILEGKSSSPIVVIDTDTEVAVNEWVTFDASDTVSPDGKKLSFNWDFADGTDDNGASVEHKFGQEGVYSVTLIVDDGTNKSEKQIVVTAKLSSDFVGGYNGISNVSVLNISEVLANPVGSDTTEFVELFNPSDEDLDISGLKLDDEEGGSKAYTFPDKTIIKTKEYKVFGRQDTKLAFNNTSDSVRILYPDGTILTEIRFDDVVEGASYVRNSEGIWVWTSSPTPGEENFINENTKVKGIKIIKSKSNSIKPVINTTLEKVRDEDLGDLVSVTGTVAVEPGVLGTQFFYIINQNAGVQVYMYSKDFPKLQIGDEIEITGEITETSGETRIKLKEKKDIKILGHVDLPQGKFLELENIGEAYEGSLLVASGEITEIKSSYMYIDDGTEEIKVYFKAGAGIRKDVFQEGDLVRVTGLLHQTKTEYQLLPRMPNDIMKTGVTEDFITKQEQAKEQDSADMVEKYLVATAG
ncbi:MAG: hypothetical protein COY69_02360, partial [Candidatus Magasanikbacteria bacterium CG_4_10_14_0_8_um_filter_32_14]